MRIRERLRCFGLPAVLLALAATVEAQALLDLHGIKQDHLGCALRAAGDFDRDGFPDVLVGALQLNRHRPSNQKGGVAVLSGRDASILFRVTGNDYLALTGNSEVRYFGVEGAVAGDLDLDGTCDVLVVHGNPKVLRSITAFSGRTGALLFELDDPHGNTSYGSSLAMLGDVLDPAGAPFPDGVMDFAVGAALNPLSFGIPTYPGKVYLYSGASATSGPVVTLAGPFPRIAFGSALAVVGDLDGDGLPALAVSASQGAYVEVFDGPGFASMLVLNSPFQGAVSFGEGLAHVGDLDGDGWSELAVGAPGARQGVGSVVVYSLDPANPLELFRIRPANPVPGTAFGQHIADLPRDPLTGLGLLDLDHDSVPDPFLDWNRDGVGDYVIGAPGLDGPAVNSGGLFLVPGTGASIEVEHPLQQGPAQATGYAYLPALVSSADDAFGQHLAIVGHVAGESQVRLAVGAPRDDGYRGQVAVLRPPLAHFDDDTFSLANDGVGSSRLLALDFGPRYAGQRFVLLATTAGSSPGQLVQGRTIPLNDDGPGGLWERTTALQTDGFPLRFSELTGLLDGLGRAQVTVEVTAPPAGHPWFSVPEQLYLPVLMRPNRPNLLAWVGAPTVLRVQ